MAKELKYNTGEPVMVEYARKCYELPIASVDRLGGIKVGENLTITDDGILSASREAGSSEIIPVFENETTPNATTLDALGVIDFANNDILFKVKTNYNADLVYDRYLNDDTLIGFAEPNLFAHAVRASNSTTYYLYDKNTRSQILTHTVRIGYSSSVYVMIVDERYIGIAPSDNVGSLQIYDAQDNFRQINITNTGLTSGQYFPAPFTIKISEGVFHKFYFGPASGMFEINVNNGTITRLNRLQSITIDGDFFHVVMYDTENFVAIVNINGSPHIFNYKDSTLNEINMPRATPGQTIQRMFKVDNYIYAIVSSYWLRIDINSNRAVIQNSIETLGLDFYAYGYGYKDNTYILNQHSGDHNTKLFTFNPYHYISCDIATIIRTYTLETLNAIQLMSAENTYQVPINKWYQFIDDLINKDGTTLTINDIVYSNFIANEDNTLSSKNCTINLTNYTISLSDNEE